VLIEPHSARNRPRCLCFGGRVRLAGFAHVKSAYDATPLQVTVMLQSVVYVYSTERHVIIFMQ
jgi:hypothetical protein